MMIIDPYKRKEQYLRWKEKVREGIPDLSKDNSVILLQYLHDMEIGVNIAGSKKGARSYLRLFACKNKIQFLMNKIDEQYGIKNIIKSSEEDWALLFTNMRNGTIQKVRGGTYKDVADYVMTLKAFWHWHQRVSMKKGIKVDDITSPLDTSKDKPQWVYINEEQFKLLCNHAKFEYKVLMWFMYDTGIRPPKELANIKVSDLDENIKVLDIRKEISKNKDFPRKINLMLCTDLLKEHIKRNKLTKEDYLFNIKPATINKYFNRLGKRVFGDKKTRAGQKYSQLTMYDFRHNSACYWLPRYPDNRGIMYRLGWKQEKEIYYYTEFLGMADNIKPENLHVGISKTLIESKIDTASNENTILKETVNNMQVEISELKSMIGVFLEKNNLT